jgi:hypothetical protein
LISLLITPVAKWHSILYVTKIRRKMFNCKFKHSFILPLILEKLNVNIPGPEASTHLSFVWGVFLLALVCLLSFINVVSYLTSIYLIQKYDINIKFPKFQKFIRYFENSSLFFVVIEIIICITCLLGIIIFSLYKLGHPMFS